MNYIEIYVYTVKYILHCYRLKDVETYEDTNY